jgi:hypothetical protein
VERGVCAEWPEILCPAPGRSLPVADTGKSELALVASAGIAQQGPVHAAMLRAFNTVMRGARGFDFSLVGGGENAEQSMEREIEEIRPTVLWMHIQYGPSPVSSGFIERVRRQYGLTVVVWDGDQHFEPDARERSWFIELGRVCDISLVKNTLHPYQYREYGVRHPGCLEQGVDTKTMRPYELEFTGPWPDVVMLANEYPSKEYEHRDAFLWELRKHYGTRFGLFGRGWAPEMMAAAPALNDHAAVVYSRSKASLSLSIRNDLPRYTSIRAMDIIASGGVALIERFPDCEGLGFVDGVNCFLWDGMEELESRIEWVCAQPRAALNPVRCAARELSLEHSWEMHVRKLLAMVNAVRA